MLPSRGQGVRHNSRRGSSVCLGEELRALTTEKFLGVVTLLREGSDLYPTVRSSLTIDELSSVLFNRRGQDGQGHASHDELDDLHLLSQVLYEKSCNERVENSLTD